MGDRFCNQLWMETKMINPFKKQYWISPTAEWYDCFDKKYQEWGFGRVEVYDNDDCYDIYEYRYCFPPELRKKFRDYIDDKVDDYNWFQLMIIKWTIRLMFYKPPKHNK